MALTIALAISAAGATSAGALSLDTGITVDPTTTVPQTPEVQVPQVPNPPALPAPVRNTIDQVNQTTSNVTSGGKGSGTGSSGGAAKTQAGGGSTSGGGSASGPRAGGTQSSDPQASKNTHEHAVRRAARRRVAGGNTGAFGPSPLAPGAGSAGTVPASNTAQTTGDGGSSGPISTVINKIEKVIPGPVKALIAALAALALGLGIRSRFAVMRARRLEHQRQELLGDVGLLQRALLPEVPDDLTGIEVSVAYRPADGPAAGGDFYDVFELEPGKTAIIVGDVCGHGRAALAVTALMRYTLRAYLGAGFEPRDALQVAGRAVAGDPDSELTTVVAAIYDAKTGALTYACAGHEPPIVLGGSAFEPVTIRSSPPIGGFMSTGHRQTTIALPPGSSACFFTDGLVEARLGEGMIGRERLAELVSELEPDEGAQLLLDRLADRADRAPDDMAACLVRTDADAVTAPASRIEEIEADAKELAGDEVQGFLVGCGVPRAKAEEVVRAARAKAAEFGGALIRVHAEGDDGRVAIVPRETARLPVPVAVRQATPPSIEVPA